MRIALVDATNQFVRNYAVVPTLDRNGAPAGGYLGFLKTVGNIIRICAPQKLILVWDGAGGSLKRRAIVKEYKEGRRPLKLNWSYEFDPEDIEKNRIEQRVRLNDYLNDLPVSQMAVDNVEADDVIAYLVKYYPNDEKVIISSDKDFFQLLDSKTLVYNPTKKEFINNKDVYERYEIYPHNFALARAIVGDDRSDNIKGVKGIGWSRLHKYFPQFKEKEHFSVKDLLNYAKSQGKKYEKFIGSQVIIENNHKIMQLAQPLVSPYSIQKIKKALGEELKFNRSAFRMKLIEDGLEIFPDYLTRFIPLFAGGTDGAD